jgi:hypothetical protein
MAMIAIGGLIANRINRYSADEPAVEQGRQHASRDGFAHAGIAVHPHHQIAAERC